MDERDRILLGEKAAVLKALGHPTRLFIVEALGRGERCVCEFVDEIGADFSTISRHLSLLKQAGIIEDEKRGQQVFYRLRVSCVLSFINCIETVVESRARAQAALFA
jgi:ArsR family transcriptional regulator